MQFGQLKRREFLPLVGGVAAWSFSARAQLNKLPSIGFFGSTNPTVQQPWVNVFVQRLRELGWIEGRTVAIEYRWAEGRPERFAAIAAELVQLKVDIIFAMGTEAALAAKKATATIPIVFPVASDPVGTGLVASLSQPRSNATGMSSQARDLGAKRLEYLRMILPAMRRLAFLANPDFPGRGLELEEVRAAAQTLGFEEVVVIEMRRPQDIAGAFATVKDRVDAVYVVADPLANINRMRISTFALAARLPTVSGQREYVEAGGLISYGPNYLELNRRAADYVDKILHGAMAASLPVEQPTKFELLVNLITAEALALGVPPNLLAVADEVIE